MYEKWKNWVFCFFTSKGPLTLGLICRPLRLELERCRSTIYSSTLNTGLTNTNIVLHLIESFLKRKKKSSFWYQRPFCKFYKVQKGFHNWIGWNSYNQVLLYFKYTTQGSTYSRGIYRQSIYLVLQFSLTCIPNVYYKCIKVLH